VLSVQHNNDMLNIVCVVCICIESYFMVALQVIIVQV